MCSRHSVKQQGRDSTHVICEEYRKYRPISQQEPLKVDVVI